MQDGARIIDVTAMMLPLRLPNPDRRFLFFEYLALSIFVYFGILSICITPNMPVAYMFSGTVYFSACCSWCQNPQTCLVSVRLACATVPAGAISPWPDWCNFRFCSVQPDVRLHHR